MRCVNCGNDAAKLYEREDGDRVISVQLCPACFRKLYGDLSEGEFFAAFSDTADGNKECPTCGTKFSDFRATGLLGCADCYTTFRKELYPVVYSAQGVLSHTGSGPNKTPETRYDDIIVLVNRKRELERRIKAARSSGDDDWVKALEEELSAVNRKLYGGDEA